MPYCPKCDMEFVEGVTVCTDCGGPLVESKEVAEAMKKAEKERQMEELRRRLEEAEAAQAKEEEAGEGTEAGFAGRRYEGPAKAYVDKSQQFEDMNSSATAFFLVGGVLAVLALLSLAGIIRLPLAGVMGRVFWILLAVLSVGSFAVAVSSRKSAKTLKAEAKDEKQQTEEILGWFTNTYSASDLDHQLFSEDPDLSGEELSLKRFELIQDYLITGRDLPDPSYVDALCEMIYSRLYGKD